MMLGRRRFLSTSGRAAAGVVAGTLVPVWWKPSAAGRVMIERTVVAMGTTVSITAYGENRAHLIKATTEAFEELHRLDRQLSVFRPTSEISQLNAADVGEPVQLGEVTMEVLAAAGRYTELTAGRFDVTVGGLLSSMGFHEDARARRTITDHELADVKEGIGWQHIRLGTGGHAIRTHAATQIDLGGIGAGFAVDRMGTILQRHGIEAGLINHSGDVLAIGTPPEAEGWTVAIPDPLAPDRHLIRLTLRDQALSTSSNYRTTRIVGGQKVGHILEPQTGENPEQWASVTMLAPTSLEADALSTALFVNANPSGKWRNGRREALLVRPDGREHSVERIR